MELAVVIYFIFFFVIIITGIVSLFKIIKIPTSSEADFTITSGVGLLGKAFKCKGAGELLSYVSNNFINLSDSFRISVTHKNKKMEFICFLENQSMVVCIDAYGQRLPLGEKPIKDAITGMIRVTENLDSKDFQE